MAHRRRVQELLPEQSDERDGVITKKNTIEM